MEPSTDDEKTPIVLKTTTTTQASNIKVKYSQFLWNTLENDRIKMSHAGNPIFVEILGELTKNVFVNSTTTIDTPVLSIHLLATRPLLDSLCMFTAHCNSFSESILSNTMYLHVIQCILGRVDFEKNSKVANGHSGFSVCYTN